MFDRKRNDSRRRILRRQNRWNTTRAARYGALLGLAYGVYQAAVKLGQFKIFYAVLARAAENVVGSVVVGAFALAVACWIRNLVFRR